MRKRLVVMLTAAAFVCILIGAHHYCKKMADQADENLLAADTAVSGCVIG